MLKKEAPLSSQSQDDDAERSRLSTQRKVNASFAIALACLVLVALASFFSAQGLKESARWVDHTHDVLITLEKLQSLVNSAESAERGYVITGDDELVAAYQSSVQTVHDIQHRLAALTRDSPTQQQRLQALDSLVATRLTQLDAVIDLRRTQGFDGAQREMLKGLGKQMHQQIRAAIDEMVATEQRLLAERQAQAQRSTLITQSTTWGGAAVAFLVVGLSVVAIRRDILGRERAERQLRQAHDELESRIRQRTEELASANRSLTESERRFRAFVGATSDVVYRMSPDWSEMHHLEGQQFIADTTQPDRSWLDKYIHPDDQAQVTGAIREAIREQKTFELEHRVRQTDGTLGWTFSRAIPISENGKVVEWFGAATDVTARKEAQIKANAHLARLALLSQITRAIGERQDIKSIFQVVIRTLEEQLPADFCCVCLYDPTANELIVSGVGRHSAPLAIELAMTEQAHIPIDQNGLSRCVRGQLVYEPDLQTVAFPFPRRLLQGGLNAFVAAPLVVESQVFGMLLTARRERNSFSSGECEFIRQLSEHVALATHQTQLYAALQRAYDDLRHTQQAVMQQERLLALGKMASGIAHDINNAISPISLYTESLLERETDISPRTRQYLETIQRAIEDVAHTVSRMREFYRQREPETSLKRVDLNQLIKQVIDLTRARWSDMAQQRGIVIDVQAALAADLPPIMGVEGELRDALTNLVFNAVDAMPEGGTLTVRTRVSSSTADALNRSTANDLVQIEVVDNGVGMDEETQRRCLEPFFTTKGERGTGLGLAMVYGTVQRHNAVIEVVSALSKGTTVRISFPRAAPDSGVIVSRAAAAVPALRILLIDDDPIVIKSVEEILKLDGHRVSSADGGQAGIDSFLAARSSGSPFQVVITDLGMPYVDGRRVSAAVKGAAPETVVLLLTGWGQRLIADGEVPTHVDRVLSKPPKLRELREALAQTIGRPSSERSSS